MIYSAEASGVLMPVTPQKMVVHLAGLRLFLDTRLCAVASSFIQK
jgi:hypothetical protein